MKTFTVFCMIFTLSLFGASNVSAQASLDSYIMLDEEQTRKGREIQDGYKEEKADLELQLKKLVKDRDIAIKDKNTALVNKRNAEIKMTRRELANLSKKYNQQFSDILTDEQRAEMNIDADFYAKELAAEQAKMKAAEQKKAQTAKKPAPKKKAPAKKKPAAKPKTTAAK